MSLVRFSRFFLPLQNAAGFGLADFAEFGLALLFVAVLLSWRRIEPVFVKISHRPVLAMALLGVAPIVLRLLLLPHHPIPFGNVSDDFSYLLLGDTFAHFRLANRTHPLHRFFECVFVLQEPTYSSIYPPAQGLVLAAGELLFGLPWAGVAISIGVMCALVYWMLRAWTTPKWALLGGLLAVMQFGPLNQWMNNFWGGALSASAGCLVFGALPRLRESLLRHRKATRHAILLGIGLGVQMLSRPFESMLLDVCVLLYAAIALRDARVRSRIPSLAAIVFAAVLPAIGFTLLHNRAVTGSWTDLPYMLSRYQYGIPSTFTFQKMSVPHRPLTQEQRLDYDAQKDVHGDDPETFETFFDRYTDRIGFYKFFFYAALYIPLFFFLPSLREWRWAWLAICGVIFSLGTNIYPYFYQHYMAALTGIFVLLPLEGLRRMAGLRFRGWNAGREAAAFILLLCGAQFVLWYGVHLFGNETLLGATQSFESWDYINFGDDLGRLAINRRFAAAAGKQLVFVRYGPHHTLQEWVHDAADIDRSPVVWAIDLGPEENRKLISCYPDRKVWLIEPDEKPPKLMPYDSALR
ncbi:MAG TPA: hypothetical protein VG345_03385 [Bryobacteraceae bacterium]|jgi:hypothetical protein|nr:hypothetical protein [Bryobacteraceae bacterium]